MFPVETSNLVRSAKNLAASLAFYEKEKDGDLSVIARNSVVLEFTICWQLIRPTLERCLIRLEGLERDAVKEMKLVKLLRTANDMGYTKVESEQWEEFLKARNESAHIYRESVAEDILQKAPDLLEAAEDIIASVARKEAQ